MIHELLPWRTLTRSGAIPAMKVIRRDLVLGEVTIPVGQTLDPEVFPPNIRRERLRQFYEQRRLEPVDAPANSRQWYREQFARKRGEIAADTVEPITPVASQVVAGLPALEVPVEADEPKRKPPKGVR